MFVCFAPNYVRNTSAAFAVDLNSLAALYRAPLISTLWQNENEIENEARSRVSENVHVGHIARSRERASE